MAWTLKDAQETVSELVEQHVTLDDYISNRVLVEDRDHWRDGDSWVGPRGSSAGIWAILRERIEPQFTPNGATEEAVGRWVDALVKTEADVRFEAREPGAKGDDGKPAMTEQQQSRAEEIRALLSRWWDRVNLWEHVRTAARHSRWSGRGVLRVRIPDGVRGEADQTGRRAIPPASDPTEALNRVALSAEESNTAGVYTDPDTLRQSALFLYRDAENRELAQVWEIGENGELTVSEIGGQDDAPVTLPRATRLPIVEMRADLLVTETVRRIQKQLDFLSTLVTRNGETASFPERYALNAGPHGIWRTSHAEDVRPLKQETIDGVTWYLIEVPLTLGASTFTNLRGFEYDVDDQGRKGVTSPSVARFEPVNPSFAIDPAVHSYAMLMKNCHQGHVVAQEVAQRSGIFVEQARADFDADVEKGNGPVVGLVVGILEAAMSLGAAMSEELAAMLAEYRPVVTLHVDTGPRSVAERTQDAADVAAGLLSDETAMLRNGIEDVQAERARIAASPAGHRAQAKSEAEITKAWGDATGMDWVTCAVLAGVPEEKIEKAMKLARQLNAPVENGNGNGRVPVLAQ